MLTIQTYRNGHAALDKRLALALAHFYRINYQLPERILVNGAELERARGCETAGVPVEVSGGVLIGEIWLAVEVSR